MRAPTVPTMPGAPWWDSAVVYQIYPRSFADATGDGVGDLPGLTAHLDHLAWLGVDAIWLTPHYPSPNADFGYDVADLCDVDPVFGTIDDFGALVAAAHERDLRVVIDHVPNHTSIEHPWFVASRSGRDDPKRDWYWWRDGSADGGPPTNWRATFTGEHRWERDADGQLRPTWVAPPSEGAATSAWTFDDASAQWYLHTFLPEQPDLNWRNPEVADAMLDVLRFWLARGVDGFRVDALRTMGKPERFVDLPPERVARPQAALDDLGRVDEAIAAMRRTVAEGGGEPMLIGEMHGDGPDAIVRHVGDGLLTGAFDFPLMYEPWDRDAWRAQVTAVVAATGARPDARLSWVLSNHDEPRVAERYGSEARARAALVAVLTLPGSAFLYQGDELGLRDAVVPPDRVVDPGGRDGCRAPIPWTAGERHGWPADPWLPFPANASGHDVATQRADPGSTLRLCRRVLRLRRSEPALRLGGFGWVDAEAPVLAWRREAAGRAPGRALLVVAVNFRPEPARLEGHDGWVVAASSTDPVDHRRFAGTLGGDEAVVLRPAP